MNQTKLNGLTLRAKAFSTGSVGYYAFGKTVVDGKICQAGLNVVEVNSKGKALNPEPDRLADLAGVSLKPVDFKTGSKGFRANGKVVINNRIYQVGGNVTIVGSKNAR